jgi:hypothetical protein
MSTTLEKLKTIQTPDIDIIDIPASEIRIVSKNRALIFGQDARFDDRAFRSLVSSTRFDNAAVDALDEAIVEGAGFEAVNQILRKSKDSFTLAFDGRNVTRLGTTNKMQGAITGAGFYTIMEKLVHHRPDLDIDSIHVDSDGLGATINFMTKEEMSHPLMREEAIRNGMSIDFQRFSGVSFQSFVQRLVCTNGMIGTQYKDRRMLNLTEDPSIWYDKLFNEASAAQVVQKYWDAVSLAGGTQMSVRELNMLNKFLFTNFPNDVDKMSSTVLGDSSWKGQYTERGFNIDEFKTEQAAMAPTPINRWAAINVLTDIVSHPTKSAVVDMTRNDGMKLAGELLFTHNDSRNWLLNLPSFQNN